MSSRRSNLPCALWCLLALAAFPQVRAETNDARVLADLKKIPHPVRESEFQAAPGLPGLSQGKTLICWSFATCAFLESELLRLGQPPVRLSVMYPAYCRYLEKARRFAQTRGATRLTPGDIFLGVPEICERYGALPAEVYEKGTDGPAYDQKQLYAELKEYAQQATAAADWDEERVVARVKQILDKHLGAPPATFRFHGKTCTPQSFLAEQVRLPWKEYVCLMSFASSPFNTFAELKVPDNWRHSTNFLNVPLPVFYDAFKHAIRAGFTVAVEMDNSEPCYEVTGRYCFIPDTDVPAARIDQAAREARFVSGATEDDHALQLNGWANIGGQDWFLGQDSWRLAWRDGNHGTIFIHGDYVKLKVLAFLVHRDGVPQVMGLLSGK